MSARRKGTHIPMGDVQSFWPWMGVLLFQRGQCHLDGGNCFKNWHNFIEFDPRQIEHNEIRCTIIFTMIFDMQYESFYPSKILKRGKYIVSLFRRHPVLEKVHFFG